jgi:hypothetical protein
MTASVLTPLTEPLPSSTKKRRVLLVDSSSTTRDLRSETMRKLGMDVDCAATISEARSWWRADLYNLVLISGEDELDHRDKFCADIRSATPPQPLAFLVGKPDYLADLPNSEGSLSVPENGGQAQGENPEAASVGLPEAPPQRWGILEASRRISVVRSLSHARSKAMRERPAPPRDSEIRTGKRTTELRTLDDLLIGNLPEAP